MRESALIEAQDSTDEPTEDPGLDCVPLTIHGELSLIAATEPATASEEQHVEEGPADQEAQANELDGATRHSIDTIADFLPGLFETAQEHATIEHQQPRDPIVLLHVGTSASNDGEHEEKEAHDPTVGKHELEEHPRQRQGDEENGNQEVAKGFRTLGHDDDTLAKQAVVW